MHALGIYTGADLLDWSLAELQPIFGKAAEFYFNAARGIDKRVVETFRVRKSVSTEDTFAQDISVSSQMLKILEQQSETVS